MEATQGQLKDRSFYRFLLSNVRSFYSVDVAFIHARLFEGMADYPNGIKLTDILSEFWRFSQITQATIPGDVLVSHLKSFRDQGGKRFIQVDDGVSFEEGTNIATHVNSNPIDPKKLYQAFLPLLVAKKKNDGANQKYLCPILHEYFMSRPDHLTFHKRHQPPNITTVFLQALIPSFWKEMFKGLTFSMLDLNRDGALTKSEISAQVGEDGASAMFLLAAKDSRREVIDREAWNRILRTQ